MTIKEFAETLKDACKEDECPFQGNCPLKDLTKMSSPCAEVQTEDWLKFLVLLDSGPIEIARYCGNCKHVDGLLCMIRDGKYVGDGKVCMLWQEKEK